MQSFSSRINPDERRLKKRTVGSQPFGRVLKHVLTENDDLEEPNPFKGPLPQPETKEQREALARITMPEPVMRPSLQPIVRGNRFQGPLSRPHVNQDLSPFVLAYAYLYSDVMDFSSGITLPNGRVFERPEIVQSVLDTAVLRYTAPHASISLLSK